MRHRTFRQMLDFRRILASVLCTAALAATPAWGIGTLTSPRLVPSAGGDAVTAADQTAYVANASLDRVAVISQTLDISYIPVGRTPRFIAMTSRGFITSNTGDNTVSVQTSGSTAVSVAIGGSGPILSNGNTAWVLRSDGAIVRIDVATLTFTSFDSGLRAPVGHALNGAGNRLYVADASGEVRVFDITASNPAQAMESFRLPGPLAAVVAGGDPRLYVLTDAAGGAFIELDLATNTTRTFGLSGNLQGARVLRNTGSMLMAGFSNGLAFLDLATHNATFLRTGEVRALSSNSQSGLAFAVTRDTLYAIDDRTMEIQSVAVSPDSSDVTFLYKPCTAYVAGPVTSLVHVPCGDLGVGGIRAHALWWVPDGKESGWGMNIAHHGSKLFATWFTYDANGQPTWLVMSDTNDVGRNGYEGALYRTTGPAFSAASFDPSKVTRTAVGNMSVQVYSVNQLDMNATVDGATIKKTLGRQVFAAPVPYCEAGLAPGPLPIYQDLWWNPAESGWGLNIAHQGNILFITWFTYDTDGKAVWFVGSDIEKTGNGTYSGTLYKTFGPPITASPWDPSKVTRMPVGSATLTFNDDDHGTFAYTVSGVSGSKSITREVFASPMTRCR